MTYSIVAIDREAGLIGVAVQSHYFGVGSLVAWARPGVGVVATQSVVRAAYGPELLNDLARGGEAAAALEARVAADAGRDLRQIAVMDASGTAAAHTGAACIQAAGHLVDDGLSVQGNLVVGAEVWTSMRDAYRMTSGGLAEKMLAALDAAEAAGGDLRGRQAAAMIIVRTESTGDLGSDTVLDVRVDDHDDPLRELRRLVTRSGALSGLVRLLEEPGLLTGPVTASPGVVAAALEELERAQRVLGPGNTEPSLWAGLLLARLGRPDEARERLAVAASKGPDPAPLLRSLAMAGMWEGPPEPLIALVPSTAERPDHP